MAEAAANDQQRRARPNRQDNRNQKPREEKIFEEFVINIDRVARVVKGGRRFRFKALVAIGDGKSRVGIGVAKGADVQAAVAKATDVAKKTLVTIPIHKATIPHDVNVKIGGANVLLKPASPGTGVIAGGVVRSIIGLTGVHNLLSKSLGSSNKVNNAYATMEALRQLVPADQWLNAPKKKTAEKKTKAVETKAEKPEKIEG
jgi:small subunit ribosomal protein S5